jgi:hypothetical protein
MLTTNLRKLAKSKMNPAIFKRFCRIKQYLNQIVKARWDGVGAEELFNNKFVFSRCFQDNKGFNFFQCARSFTSV